MRFILTKLHFNLIQGSDNSTCNIEDRLKVVEKLTEFLLFLPVESNSRNTLKALKR